jgi:hypothetical protein
MRLSVNKMTAREAFRFGGVVASPIVLVLWAALPANAFEGEIWRRS